MKIYQTIALTVLLAASSQASAETCSLAQMASLDMTMLPEGRFAVPVSINGTSHLMMVDTAGIYSRITAEAAQKIGLSTAPSRVEIYGVNGKERMLQSDIASLKIGDNEAKHFHLGIGGFDPHGSAAEGILSQDLLTLFDVELDFAAKKMNLFSQQHCPGKVVYWTRSGYAEVPFRFSNGAISAVQHIDFNMTLDGQEVTADFDTGSYRTWLRAKMASRLFGLELDSPGVTRTLVNDKGDAVYTKQFVSLQAGGIGVSNPVIELVADQTEESFRREHSEKSRDDPVYGSTVTLEPLTLGMNVISKLHTFVAFKEHKLYITATDAH